MERLTKRLNGGKALCIEACEKECTEGHCECHKCEPFVDVLKRLAEYEDIDLTPEQIIRLDKLFLAKCEEVNRLRAELERLKGNSSGVQGDLISRSALIQQLREEGRLTYLIKGAIDNQTTAFDVEKVVEQLDDLLYDRCYSADYKVGTKEMEKIVRNGGKE